jgi:predicted glycoside hydrolase/deacetylase ChbG (UPF0249 family)
MNQSQTNQQLGYPADARLLILNADDFGMCNSINEAIFRVLEEGVVRSTSLMVPCPWALHAMHFLKDHPEIPFGVHLTAIWDADDYAWGPVTCREKVPSLVDQAGRFHSMQSFPAVLDQSGLEQLEVEFRAQIEVVLAAGLHPAHLDWHSLRMDHRTESYDLMLRLAKEYGLALRMTGRSMIQKVQSQGLPCNDHDLLDSFSLDPLNKPARYAQLLHELPAGLSEWAIHPGLDNAELLALEPDGDHIRQTDYDFWISQQAKELIRQEGIIVLDYRALQAVWKEVLGTAK